MVFLKIDRLARKTRLLLTIWDDLEASGVGVVSVEGGSDTTTSAGKLSRNMFAAFAEFEREQIAERTMMGKRGAAERGQFTGGVPAFGYRHDAETKYLLVDEAEAAVVRRVFR